MSDGGGRGEKTANITVTTDDVDDGNELITTRHRTNDEQKRGRRRKEEDEAVKDEIRYDSQNKLHFPLNRATLMMNIKSRVCTTFDACRRCRHRSTQSWSWSTSSKKKIKPNETETREG
ncbi:hypothetical protein RDWZM_010541 [Blomia tropicalis]|uniref:Uncharacterized protein n=1 Tax=Blomia tropicalis TaxID=40697 RepID=A0A9Q0RK75_BLOTA|nr:hypothetical protein RDWZM_010541 [Blomia tropicalis]